ncbi:hypothetical protein Tco_1475833 [Tanacetum coccineum]
MLAWLYASKNSPILILSMNKCTVYTVIPPQNISLAKKDSKARLLRWVLLLQELVYEKPAILPIELKTRPTGLDHMNFDLKTAAGDSQESSAEMNYNELRDDAL